MQKCKKEDCYKGELTLIWCEMGWCKYFFEKGVFSGENNGFQKNKCMGMRWWWSKLDGCVKWAGWKKNQHRKNQRVHKRLAVLNDPYGGIFRGHSEKIQKMILGLDFLKCLNVWMRCRKFMVRKRKLEYILEILVEIVIFLLFTISSRMKSTSALKFVR